MKSKKSEFNLKHASQAQILRSHQRDGDFIKYLREQILSVIQAFGGQRFLYLLNSDVPVSLLYFAVTTAMGNQTLGEEYTGILQVNLNDLNTRKIPLLPARIISIALECFAERTLIKLLEKLQMYTDNPCNELTPSAHNFFNFLLPKLRALTPVLILLHKGVFYINGKYYTIGKRVSKIDYLKVHSVPINEGTNWGLKLLGFMTFIQCGVKLWQNRFIESGLDQTKRHMSRKEGTDRICRLCFTETSTTTTPCGHLFCWTCLCDWLHAKTQCPLCREYIAPSRVVYLINL